MSEPLDWAEVMEARLLQAALPHTRTLGWTSRAIAAGALEAGLSAAEAELLLPHGPRDLAALMTAAHDREALQILTATDVGGLKIRERIRVAVLARCDAAMADESVTRRWLGFLALPTNIPLALRLGWTSADCLWRWAGDTATDENHYTKRALLAEILASTLAVRLTSGPAAAEAHLDGRIGAVMAFERWKAGIRPADAAHRIVAGLGRLRYGRS